ncbi:DUF3244 domain-containing protein [Parabacteroides faecis]|uniref:DUF3244 domain-containing protein n=1 Tax=Parabacteroides faecis TaxID=1217282 RepID=A0ABR6KFE7_9BACT|nr:DUF3244 domain-containing protein [Parabacteroides faecis]MBB4620229.1 hypothetical protein [Parabacteroides faecis]
MNRSLLVMVLLCATVFGFAKRKIDLNDHARFPQPPIEVFIDEESRELTLNLKKGEENIRVVITDFSGNRICNDEVRVDGTCILPLPMIEKGEYILDLFLDNMELQGFFEIK